MLAYSSRGDTVCCDGEGIAAKVWGRLIASLSTISTKLKKHRKCGQGLKPQSPTQWLTSSNEPPSHKSLNLANSARSGHQVFKHMRLWGPFHIRITSAVSGKVRGPPPLQKNKIKTESTGTGRLYKRWTKAYRIETRKGSHMEVSLWNGLWKTGKTWMREKWRKGSPARR